MSLFQIPDYFENISGQVRVLLKIISFNESYHLVFLVALVEGLLGLASFYIHLSAHGISVANVAGTEVIGVFLAK